MRKLIHRVLRLHWLAIAGIAYWVMLGLQLLVIPHDFSCFGTAAPYFAATTLMLVFGPYLFVVELCDGWVGGSAWWMLKMLPVYLVYLGLAFAFIARLTRGWRAKVRRSRASSTTPNSSSSTSCHRRSDFGRPPILLASVVAFVVYSQPILMEARERGGDCPCRFRGTTEHT